MLFGNLRKASYLLDGVMNIARQFKFKCCIRRVCSKKFYSFSIGQTSFYPWWVTRGNVLE